MSWQPAGGQTGSLLYHVNVSRQKTSLSLWTVKESTGNALKWRRHHNFCPIITCTVIAWFARFSVFFVGCEKACKVEKQKLAMSVLAIPRQYMSEGGFT